MEKQKRPYTKGPNWKPRGKTERKRMAWVYVKPEHWKEFQNKITEEAKKYR